MSHLHNKPAAEIVNSLNIQGQLFHARQGKEIILGVDNVRIVFRTLYNIIMIFQVLFRIGLGLEAHCLWIPTSMYHEIVGRKLEKRGQKSYAYGIPSKFFDGPPGSSGQISIQLAFIRPDWTLIFADHNVMISFHIMYLRFPCQASDFDPGSKVLSIYISYNIIF